MSYQRTGLGLPHRSVTISAIDATAPRVFTVPQQRSSNVNWTERPWQYQSSPIEYGQARLSAIGITPEAYRKILERNRARLSGMGYIQPLDCTPPGGIGTPSTACVDENARIQQLNMAEHDAAQRDIFLENCNRDWELNDAQYQALGLPRPVNTCDQRLFGQTLPGTTGGAQEDPIPGSYIPAPAPILTPVNTVAAAVIAAPAAVIPVTSAPAAPSSPVPVHTAAPSNQETDGGYVAGDTSGTLAVLRNDFDVAGYQVPVWGVLAAAGIALVLFGGKR